MIFALDRLSALFRSFLALDERRCAACLAPFVPERGDAVGSLFCKDCRPAFRRRDAGFCPHCGEPSVIADAPVVPCSECLQKLPPWEDFIFYGIYDGLLREMVLRAKFGSSLSALAAMGGMMAELCAEYYSAHMLPHVIVPLPLHPARLRERGLDQCLEIARPVAAALNIPLERNILRKIVHTRAQEGLSRERRRELEQPFSASPEVCGARVLLLDDVCTTGTTLARATECLKSAGAVSVDVAVMARASLHSISAAGK